MVATPTEINNYLLDITYDHSDFGKKVAKHYRLGRSDMKLELLQLTILSYYIRIMERYFSGYNYEQNNYFTESEVKDIMERINGITKNFIYLEI